MHREVAVADKEPIRCHDEQTDERAADPRHQPARPHQPLHYRLDAKEHADKERRCGSRQHAEQLEKDADSAPRTGSWHLKNAAVAWLEAGDKPKALAAAKKSAAGAPESRSGILTMQWNEGLGDVFLETGEAPLAIKHFESALASTNQPSLQKRIEKKLAEARGVASQK